MRLRSSEWVIAAYFSYAALLAWLLPVPRRVAAVTLVLNLTILAGLLLLAYADSFRQGRFLGTVRDWFPLPLMLLGYREMGWFAPQVHRFHWEMIWVQWDRVLLREWGLKAAIESLGPLLPSVLEISYSLVYTTAVFSLAMLYAYGRRKRAASFNFTFLLGIYLAYAQFPFWPSEPPRTVFPGEDFPAYFTVFRKFNWWLLGGYGIHTSVFPSAHTAGAFSAAFAMRRLLPEKPWVGRFLLTLAVLIATATVYGRYHYAADAVTGLAVAAAAETVRRVLARSSTRPV
ncbi:MAG: phosphatase PAP2 family protein [Bryobacterales bacterium]|nr:phosphatase PAP2 family protein [Bryobacterales bacterium]